MALVTLPQPSLVKDGLLDGTRADYKVINGVGYVFLPRLRPRRIGQIGNDDEHTYEVTPAGIQGLNWAPTVTAQTTGGYISVPEGESYIYYVGVSVSSSKYTPYDQGSMISTLTKVTVTGQAAATISLEIDDTGVAFPTPVENGMGTTDAVDEIWVWRTLANPSFIDSATAPSTITITDFAEMRGTLFFAGRFPLESLMVRTTWVTGTAYTAGTYVETNQASGANPDAAKYTVRYKCKAAHTADATFAPDYTLGYWTPLGYSPMVLTKADDTIATEDNLLSFSRAVPPDGYSAAVVENHLCITGQEPYELDVSVTHGSPTVTIATGAREGHDIVPDGIVWRSVEVSGDGGSYGVLRWNSATQLTLDRNFDGATNASATALVRGTKGAILCSEISETGELVGTCLPDAFGALFSVYDPGTGEDNEAVIEGGESGGAFVFQRGSVGWFRSPGDTPREIERMRVRTRGNRGITRTAQGVACIGDDGIHLFDRGPTRSIVISDAVRDMWSPTARTKFAWNRDLLDNAVLVYDATLRRLYMFGTPMRKYGSDVGGASNSLGLVWDEPSNAWQILDLWCDDSSVLAIGDVTAAAVIPTQRGHEVFVGGSLLVDTDDDSRVDIALRGRIFGLERGFYDHVPATRYPGDDQSVSNHGVVWSRAFRPIAGNAAEDVEIVGVEVLTEPLSGGGTYDMTIRTQMGHTSEVAMTTKTLRGSLASFSNSWSPPANSGSRVTVVLSGEMNSAKERTQINEIVQTVVVNGRRR